MDLKYQSQIHEYRSLNNPKNYSAENEISPLLQQHSKYDDLVKVT